MSRQGVVKLYLVFDAWLLYVNTITATRDCTSIKISNDKQLKSTRRKTSISLTRRETIHTRTLSNRAPTERFEDEWSFG